MRNLLLTLLLLLCASLLEAQSLEEKIRHAVEIIDEGQFGEGARDLEALLPEVEKKYGMNDTVELTGLLNYLGMAAFHIQQFDKAEQYLTRMKTILETVNDTRSFGYSAALNSLGILYEETGDYLRAEPMYLQVLEVDRELYGNSDTNVTIDLNNLSNFYMAMGRVEQAVPMMQEAVDIAKKAWGERHPEYIKYLNNMAMIWFNAGDFRKAEPLMRQVLELSAAIYPEDHPQYAKFLNNLAQVLLKLGDYAAAEPLFRKSLEIIAARGEENSPAYASKLNGLGMLLFKTGRYDEARSVYSRELAIDRSHFGENHPSLARDLDLLALTCQAENRNEEATRYYREAFRIYDQRIRTNTGFLSAREMEQYLGTFFFNLENYQSFNLKQSRIDHLNGDFAYDIELARKGLLLRSAGDVKRRIVESGDTVLLNDYHSLNALREQIRNMPPVGEGHTDTVVQQMKQQANDLEKSLSLRSLDFRKSEEERHIFWTDIAKNLKNGEAAIEFSRFEYFNGKDWTDTIYYCAILLRKGDSLPGMIYLCDEVRLRAALPPTGIPRAINAAYNHAGGQMEENLLFRLIWKPLEPLLAGIHTIWYAPAGLIHMITPEALPSGAGRCLSEKYNLVRLGSTRSLAMPEKPVPVEEAVVYGGIVYDTLPAVVKASPDPVMAAGKETAVVPWPSRGTLPGEFIYLPGTFTEAQTVAGRLSAQGIRTTLLAGTNAQEETFDRLSGGKRPLLIHVATHGFYIPDAAGGKSRKQSSWPETGETGPADDPLLRSGLLMTGANLAREEKTGRDGRDDGILTAREVSEMNLMHVQMVVLSACQTGLGDVKGSEGVEGLERGFKMAGVRYVVMSLWQVPDRETAGFMKLFYGNLHGRDFRDAFRTAQRTMKKQYPDEPYKWAGFVMTE